MGTDSYVFDEVGSHCVVKSLFHFIHKKSSSSYLSTRKWQSSSCFFIALAVVFTLSRSDPDQTPKAAPSEAHRELIKYGFPIGLLPNDNCRITLPPDNYLATYSKKITGKIVSPSSTGSASGLSSSGGASPESDPAATTWCSRLEWSPPNTLLRISTRALSVRASAPLLEGMYCLLLPLTFSSFQICFYFLKFQLNY
nr:uncharacterized protein LOC109186882 [Ipomoea batatas]